MIAIKCAVQRTTGSRVVAGTEMVIARARTCECEYTVMHLSDAMCILACLHVRMYLRACVMYSRASMHQQLFFHKHLAGSLPLAHRHFLFLAPLSHTYMQPSPLFSREDAQVIDSRL
jgi:Ni,Fe-hydrogenase I cytochrome b subunit